MSALGVDISEIVYLAIACLGGFLFAMTVFLTPLLGSYLYPKTLQWWEARGKHPGSLSRGLLAGVFWIAPVLIVFSAFIGLLGLARWVLPFPDAQLSKQAMVWGMGGGVISGVVVWRVIARRGS